MVEDAAGIEAVSHHPTTADPSSDYPTFTLYCRLNRVSFRHRYTRRKSYRWGRFLAEKWRKSLGDNRYPAPK